MAAYSSKDLDIIELKLEAQKQWEERDFKAAPDLGFMTCADIHGARSEQQLGRETLIATQSDLQEATGMTTLSDESRQLLLLSVSSPDIILSEYVLEYVFFFFDRTHTRVCSHPSVVSLQCLRDLQLANHLEAWAIRLRQESLSRLIITMAGTAASGLVKFVVDAFGSSKEMEENQAKAALHVPQEGELAEDDGGEEVMFASSTKDDTTPKQPDICPLSESKPAYPTDSLLLSVTGVPPEFISENIPSGPSRQSTYFCLFGAPCSASAHQKVSMAAHIRRKHLGVSVACKYCDCKWWTSNPFTGHMQKKHPQIEAPHYWTPIVKEEAAQEEAKAAEEMNNAPSSTTPLF